MEKDTTRGNFIIVMGAFTLEIGSKTRCKDKESSIMLLDDWPIKATFFRINSMDKELSLTKINKCS